MVNNIHLINYLKQSTALLLQKVDELSAKVDKMHNYTNAQEEKNWLNVTELQRYLPSHPRKQTIYSWTSTRRIPFHKKGRAIMFDKAEIDAWLQDSSHFKSMDEIERDALDFINSKKSNLTT